MNLKYFIYFLYVSPLFAFDNQAIIEAGEKLKLILSCQSSLDGVPDSLRKHLNNEKLLDNARTIDRLRGNSRLETLFYSNPILLDIEIEAEKKLILEKFSDEQKKILDHREQEIDKIFKEFKEEFFDIIKKEKDNQVLASLKGSEAKTKLEIFIATHVLQAEGVFENNVDWKMITTLKSGEDKIKSFMKMVLDSDLYSNFQRDLSLSDDKNKFIKDFYDNLTSGRIKGLSYESFLSRMMDKFPVEHNIYSRLKPKDTVLLDIMRNKFQLPKTSNQEKWFDDALRVKYERAFRERFQGRFNEVNNLSDLIDKIGEVNTWAKPRSLVTKLDFDNAFKDISRIHGPHFFETSAKKLGYKKSGFLDRRLGVGMAAVSTASLALVPLCKAFTSELNTLAIPAKPASTEHKPLPKTK